MTVRAAVRLATPADIPGIAAVLASNGEALERPDVVGYPYLEHLLRRGRMVIAELDGPIVGFGSVIRIGEASMVSDLFVDPAHHGQGIGSALLVEALGDDQPRMTFSSADPRALPAYIRAGMRPWWPNLYVRADQAALARLPADQSLVVEPASLDETVQLSLALAGIDRSDDFGFYATQPDAAGFVVRNGDAVAAVGWAARDDEGNGRELSHAAINRDADPTTAVAALFVAAARGESVWGCVPGPQPALPALLEAGARIVDRDTYCTSDPGWLDPERILPNPSLL
jgi:GNAT superfamily N-acetyltransferase